MFMNSVKNKLLPL